MEKLLDDAQKKFNRVFSNQVSQATSAGRKIKGEWNKVVIDLKANTAIKKRHFNSLKKMGYEIEEIEPNGSKLNILVKKK